MRARMIPVESFYQGGDTEAKAKETVITAAYECFKASQAWQERYREGGQAVMKVCKIWSTANQLNITSGVKL